MMTVAEIYEKHIKPLPAEERLRLVEHIMEDTGEQVHDKPVEPKHSLLELEGLGAEIWQGIDAKKYLDEMRDEWDRDR